jgi:uncharacterized protein YaeQ
MRSLPHASSADLPRQSNTVALKSTIYKLALAVADIERGYYADHALTIARHPSETDERMMVRVLAYAVCAHERLEFGKGISNEDEPALWQRDYTDAIVEWIDVGLPDERALRKASGRAAQVSVFAYGGRAVDVWWRQNADAFAKIANLRVFEVPFESSRALANLAARNMQLTVTLQSDVIYVTSESDSIEVALSPLLSPATRKSE